MIVQTSINRTHAPPKRPETLVEDFIFWSNVGLKQAFLCQARWHSIGRAESGGEKLSREYGTQFCLRIFTIHYAHIRRTYRP